MRKLAGTVVRVQRGSRNVDSYGRLLYYVYTPSEASIDEALIKGGLGPKLGDKMGSIGIISTNRNL